MYDEKINEYLKFSDGERDYYYYFADGNLDDFRLYIYNKLKKRSEKSKRDHPWSIRNGGVLYKYHGTDRDLVIPKEIEGVTLTALDRYAFLDTQIDSVVIRDNITKISSYAFMQSEITGVIMADSVKQIGNKAFLRCSNLKHITLSNKITRIPEYAFSECSSLKELVLPDSVTEIYAMAFQNSGLEKLVVSKSLKVINGWGVFLGCPKSLVIHGPKGCYAEEYAAGESEERRSRDSGKILAFNGRAVLCLNR